MAQHLGEQSYSVEELAGVKKSIITLTVVIFTTSLLESSVENFNAKFV